MRTVLDRAKDSLNSYDYAHAYGCDPIYPAALIRDMVAEIERLQVDRRLSGQANYLLARIVAAANVSAIEGADGFIESYNLPVGPIHKAIPFLQEQGIVVTNDGQIHNSEDSTK